MSLGDVVMTVCVLFCMGCFFALGRISMRFGGAYRRGFDAWRSSCGRWTSEPMCRKNIHTR